MLLSGSVAQADQVEKGFESLRIYNYFDAKTKFEKKLKKVPSPCAFGLATIYFRQDNPFHQIDSAYRLVHIAEQTFSALKDKRREKYLAFGFSFENILHLKQNIATYNFKQLSPDSSIAAWTTFIEKHVYAHEIQRATCIRDSLALAEAREINSSIAFNRFLEKYPCTEWRDEAQEAFDLAQYREETNQKSVTSFTTFIQKYPSNPYVRQAEDEIYSRMTELNTVESLDYFIQKNPSNRNVADAWRRLYQVYMYDYSENRIEEFQVEFPNFPFKNELKNDLKMSRLLLFPAQVFNKFGAMDIDGALLIPPIYESINLFYEGLALAGKDGKFGYINKANEVVIPFKFNSGYDFENGRAVVEIKDKFGLIDRTGKIILPIEFDDIGTFSEGLIYAQKDGKYGYYDKFGELRIKHQFSEAFTFSNGMAKVQIDDKQGFINTLGEYIIFPYDDEVRFFTENLLVYSDGSFYGLKDRNGNTQREAEFDQIGLLQDRRAMVVLDDEIGYLDSTGRVVIEPKFEVFANSIEHGQFSKGFAVVKSKGKMGIIDSSGKFVIKNSYAQLGKLSDLIAFNKGKLWGYMDLKGKTIIPANYIWAESFVGDLAIVALEDFQGIINTRDQAVLPIEYDEVTRLEDNRFMLERNGKFGLANHAGTIVVPVEYDEIRQLNAAIFVLMKEKQLEYLYLPENKIVQLK